MITPDEQISETMRIENREIGARFQWARRFLGLSLEQLANLWETSSDVIKKVEQGELQIPVAWVYRLTKFFDINANWLLFGAQHITNEKTRAFRLLNSYRKPYAVYRQILPPRKGRTAKKLNRR